MRVLVLVFVAIVCTLLPSDGGAERLTPTLHALAKRSAASLSRVAHNADINKRSWRPGFDNLYAILQEAENYDKAFIEDEVAAFLTSKEVNEFVDRFGISMRKLGDALASNPEVDDDERELVKAMVLLRLAGYDIAALAGDSSSEEFDE